MKLNHIRIIELFWNICHTSKLVNCIFCTIFIHILEDSTILNSLSSDTIQSLNSLVNIDLNRPSDKRVLPNRFHENQVCIQT